MAAKQPIGPQAWPRRVAAMTMTWPVLLALTVVIEIWASTSSELASVSRILLIAVVVTVLTTVAFTAFLGRERGSIASAAVLSGVLVARDTLMLIPFLALVPLLVLERRVAASAIRRISWPLVHRALTTFVAVLLVVEVLRFGAAMSTPGAVPSSADRWASISVDAAALHPDIYVLVLDGHGRADVLRENYAYDARAFEDRLARLGLRVSTHSRSNYMLTRFSIASMLSGAQLHDIGLDPTAPVATSFARGAIQGNAAFPLLRRAGYEITVISGGYEHIDLRAADRYLDPGQPNELEYLVLSSLGPGRLLQALVPDYRSTFVRARVRDELSMLGSEVRRPSSAPRFVYMHLPVPHWPWVFDVGCEPLPYSRETEGGISRHGGSPATIVMVRSQTACVDHLVGEAVDDLVRTSPDAVVLVISDHGPEELLDWWAPSEVGMHERSANLFAARTPGHPGLYPDDVTLANTLPLLFNAYLGTSIPLAPDELWFGPRPQDNRFVEFEPRP